MAKSDAETTNNIEEETDINVGSLIFEQENCEWSLLPSTSSPVVALSDKGCGTPKKDPCTFIKPSVGMPFENIDAAEKFYKAYAHDFGFSVRVGLQRVENGIVLWKRFMCSRQGYRKKKENVPPSNGKKKHYIFETRCGCEAHIYVKLSSDNRYTIASMIEEHNHGLVSPDKCHLLRSNRSVSERAKNTL